jgi:hypothetical protein
MIETLTWAASADYKGKPLKLVIADKINFGLYSVLKGQHFEFGVDTEGKDWYEEDSTYYKCNFIGIAILILSIPLLPFSLTIKYFYDDRKKVIQRKINEIDRETQDLVRRSKAADYQRQKQHLEEEEQKRKMQNQREHDARLAMEDSGILDPPASQDEGSSSGDSLVNDPRGEGKELEEEDEESFEKSPSAFSNATELKTQNVSDNLWTKFRGWRQPKTTDEASNSNASSLELPADSTISKSQELGSASATSNDPSNLKTQVANNSLWARLTGRGQLPTKTTDEASNSNASSLELPADSTISKSQELGSASATSNDPSNLKTQVENNSLWARLTGRGQLPTKTADEASNSNASPLDLQEENLKNPSAASNDPTDLKAHATSNSFWAWLMGRDQPPIETVDEIANSSSRDFQDEDEDDSTRRQSQDFGNSPATMRAIQKAEEPDEKKFMGRELPKRPTATPSQGLLSKVWRGTSSSTGSKSEYDIVEEENLWSDDEDGMVTAPTSLNNSRVIEAEDLT